MEVTRTECCTLIEMEALRQSFLSYLSYRMASAYLNACMPPDYQIIAITYNSNVIVSLCTNVEVPKYVAPMRTPKHLAENSKYLALFMHL